MREAHLVHTAAISPVLQQIFKFQALSCKLLNIICTAGLSRQEAGSLGWIGVLNSDPNSEASNHHPHVGRVIAQAVSRWLPTAAARVQTRVWPSGICGGQIGAGAGFLRVLRFPLPIFIPPNFP
jgi:hypothetical protein